MYVHVQTVEDVIIKNIKKTDNLTWKNCKKFYQIFVNIFKLKL